MVLWCGTVVAAQNGSFRYPMGGFFGKNPKGSLKEGSLK